MSKDTEMNRVLMFCVLSFSLLTRQASGGCLSAISNMFKTFREIMATQLDTHSAEVFVGCTIIYGVPGAAIGLAGSAAYQYYVLRAIPEKDVTRSQSDQGKVFSVKRVQTFDELKYRSFQELSTSEQVLTHVLVTGSLFGGMVLGDGICVFNEKARIWRYQNDGRS